MNPLLPTAQQMWCRVEKYPRCAALSSAQIAGIPFLVSATNEQLALQEAALEKRAADKSKTEGDQECASEQNPNGAKTRPRVNVCDALGLSKPTNIP